MGVIGKFDENSKENKAIFQTKAQNVVQSEFCVADINVVLGCLNNGRCVVTQLQNLMIWK